MKTLLSALVLSFRTATIVLCITSTAYLTTATEGDSYSSFNFLGTVLCFELVWSVIRLVQETRVTFFDDPLPGFNSSLLIVAGEFAVWFLIYGAGAAALFTEVFMQFDTNMCAHVGAKACRRYLISSILAMSASVFNWSIALILFGVLANRPVA